MADKLVLEAHVESRVRGRSENLTRLADDILRATVVIAHSVLDLCRENNESWSTIQQFSGLASKSQQTQDEIPSTSINNSTYMNVDLLAITFRATNDGSDNDKLVLRDEVANASLVLAAAGGGDEVEF